MSVSVEVVRSSVDHAAYTRPPAQLEDVIFSPAYGGRVIVPDSKPKGAPPPRPGSAPKIGRPADAPPRPSSAPKDGRPADAVAVVLDALSKTDVEKEKLSTGADVEDPLEKDAQKKLEKDAQKKLEEERLKEHLALRRKEKAAKKKKDKENTPSALGSEPPKDDIKASVDEDGTSKTTKELTDADWLAIFEWALKYVGKKKVSSIVASRFKGLANPSHKLLGSYMEKPEMVDLFNKCIVDKNQGEDSTDGNNDILDAVQENCLPFHILILLCMLNGDHSFEFFNDVRVLWTGITKLVGDQVDEKEAANQILLKPLQQHAMSSYPKYIGLLFNSTSTGFCEKRKRGITNWMNVLKRWVQEELEIYNKENALKMTTDALERAYAE